ncbi:PRPL17 [Auxenochlorella protothecoides x Auxenochlorella symbiontica]
MSVLSLGAPRVLGPCSGARAPVRLHAFTATPSYVGMRRVQITQLDPVARDSLQGAPTNGATVFAMRHGNKKAKLNLPADQRKALIRGLVTQVLRHGKIQTTKARAKAIRKHVDHIITLAKNGSLHARRQALGFVYDPELVKSVFEQAASRYGERPGGYTRVKPVIQPRRGDSAEMATIELV